MANNQQEWTTLLNQMGEGNPKMKLLAQMMAQQSESVPEEDQSQEMIEKLMEQVEKQAAIINRLSDTNKKLKGKIQLLVENLTYRIELNEVMASAIGACPDCLGEDPACKTCDGHGTPGNMDINEEAFQSLVQPFMEMYINPNAEPQWKSASRNIIDKPFN